MKPTARKNGLPDLASFFNRAAPIRARLPSKCDVSGISADSVAGPRLRPFRLRGFLRREAWQYDQPASRTPSSVVANGTVYIPSNGLTVVRPSGTDKKAPEIAWKNNRFSSGTPSPLVYRGKVFTMNGPIVKCGDAATGKLLWQLRLKGAFTSSPVAANGHLYYFGETGTTYVIDVTGAK